MTVFYDCFETPTEKGLLPANIFPGLLVELHNSLLRSLKVMVMRGGADGMKFDRREINE